MTSLFGETCYRFASLVEVADLLSREHYLGPLRRGRAFAQLVNGEVVACMVWASPTSRHLPCDGSWLELSRWCLTPAAGPNAGSRMHAAFVRQARHAMPNVTTLVSYSDPSVGHSGVLYRACNWQWAPTWQRLRPPPSGGGTWDGRTVQAVKDRWVFELKPDSRRADMLRVKDDALNPTRSPWTAGMWHRSEAKPVAS